MTYALYEVVSTEAEKEARKQEIRKQKHSDPRLYSAYIDVLPSFGVSRSQRRGMQSLMAAIRKKKFDTLVIPSYENLKMDEHYAIMTLLNIRDMGIQIALEDPKNIQSEQQIVTTLHEAQVAYLTDLLCDPSVVKGLFVDQRFEPPFVYLEQDNDQDPWCMRKRMSIPKLIREQDELGFFLYRSDRDDWFFIPPYLMTDLKRMYDMIYASLF